VIGDGLGMTANEDHLEEVLRQNLDLRRQLAAEITKASEPATFGVKVRKWNRTMQKGVFDWWMERFGRPEDQPLILALLIVLIAITLYVFL
jgi:hypothetical protein